MSALTQDRNIPEAEGVKFTFPMAAAVKSFKGGIAVLDAAGNCKPGITATGLTAIGRFQQQVDNSGGSAGDLSVEIKAGVFRFANSSAGDEITKAEIGDDCYIVDDQTVAKTDGTATRSKAGTVVNVDALGVWVKIGLL